MIDQWADVLDPQIAAYRRRTYSTALALEEMRSLRALERPQAAVQRGLGEVANVPAFCPRSACDPAKGAPSVLGGIVGFELKSHGF